MLKVTIVIPVNILLDCRADNTHMEDDEEEKDEVGSATLVRSEDLTNQFIYRWIISYTRDDHHVSRTVKRIPTSFSRKVLDGKIFC
jgi:hypothetical protein